MKTPARPLPLLAAFLFFFSVTFAAFAQEPPEKTTPAGPDSPAAEATPAAAPEAAPAPEPAAAGQSELRRLDVPESEKSDAAEDADEKTDEAVAPDEARPAPAVAPAPAAPQKSKHGKRNADFRRRGNERISIWHDSTLAAGEYAGAVVSIVGSSTSDGTVGDAVVSIFGSSTTSGDVGNAVVSVLGSTRVTSGEVGDVAIAVLGNNYINAHIRRDVVAVLGDVELGPDAIVDGNVVCVGGTVKRDAGAVVHGQMNNISIGAHFGGFEWLHAWVRHCLILGRPLAFVPEVLWAWWIALGLLALYVVFALAFPRGIERCATTFEEHPGYSILTAFLVTLLAPLAAILLAITIIGAPALIVFLFIVGLFGKAVMLAWIGRRITNRLSGPLAAPAFAVLIGGVIALLLYTIPFLGFVVAKLLSWLGVGVVIYTLLQNSKRNKAAARAAAAKAVAANAAAAATVAGAVPVTATPPSTQPPAMPASVPPAGTVETPGVASDVPTASAGFVGASVPPVVPPVAAVPPVAPPPMPPPPVVPVSALATTLPRAGFWVRAAAAALDAVLVALAIGLLPFINASHFPLTFVVYNVVLWVLKGTTVGGIVCGLKVVRLDDRPLDWATAIVRALGGFLSFVVAGLGFIWVAFDDDKQSWHDKIAGTVIVFVPRGTSLV